jgi:hypothetical protein
VSLPLSLLAEGAVAAQSHNAVVVCDVDTRTLGLTFSRIKKVFER